MTTNNQKTAVVTGVSTGIGLAVAQDLIGQGYRVFGSVRKQADGDRLREQLGAAFTPLLFDVTDTAAIPAAVAQVEAALGDQNLTALVNNAGISINGPLMMLEPAQVRQVFDVNVFGLIDVTRAFLPLLGARPGKRNGPGRIVNVSSVGGAMVTPFMTCYGASKHAVEAITQGLRRELKVFGIQVAAVEPSFIKTPIFEKSASDPVLDARYDGTAYGELWRVFNRSFLRFEKQADPVELVTRAVRHAIEAAKPKTRYPLHPIWYIGRLAPDRWFDKIIFKALGFDKVLARQGLS